MDWWIGGLAAASICIACTEPTPVGPPSVIQKVTPAIVSATAGSTIAGGVTVKVVDANGKPVSDIKVAFTVTGGDGTVSLHLVLSDADGIAHTEWTIGQTAGENALLAWIDGSGATATFTATGTPGPATAVAVSPHTLRLPVGTTTAAVAGAVVDKYGNVITGSTTFTSRNPNLVTVNPTTGAVTVVGSGGTTYIDATGANFSDSSYVIVLKTGDLPCTGITMKASLGVGEVIVAGFSDNAICVAATTTSSDYAFVPYFNSSAPSAQTSVTLRAFGTRAPGALNSNGLAGAPLLVDASAAALVASGAAFHNRLRANEEQEMRRAAPNARLWYGSAERVGHRATRSAVVPAVGDQMQLNVNFVDFCRLPNMRTGRVVAVTQRAIVVADVANPAGFSDAEYQAYGFDFDTLAYPLDVATFGEPTDIDNNGGRIVVFFTHGVNEVRLGTLGVFYGRDLLPKVGPLGSCTGSNVGEVVNLRVPDEFNAKVFVANNTVATMAHELQHLINGARRLYVNTRATPTEEVWLNEGLSHVAEELLFYRASGLTPRKNIGLELFNAPFTTPFALYQFQNFNRLREYLKAPESQSPVGFDDFDMDPATRGAISSYLRFAADQRFAADETNFWFKLVNSNLTGLNNLYDVIGPDARLLMRDWTLAILLDDLVPGVNAKYQDKSWNLRVAIGGYAPATVTLSATDSGTTRTLKAGGTVFARFGVNATQEAYVSAAGTSGTALPKNVLLALVRTNSGGIVGLVD